MFSSLVHCAKGYQPIAEKRNILPQTITAADIQWCEASSVHLSSGLDVQPSASFPGINPGKAIWAWNNGTPPESSITGGYTPGNASFICSVPDSVQLAVYFKINPFMEAQYLKYLQSVLLHELVHSRQIAPAIVRVARNAAAQEFLVYYQNPAEQEAHGAQIAYLVRTQALQMPVGVNQALGTSVGSAIQARLAPLQGGTLVAARGSVFEGITRMVNYFLTQMP